MVAILVSVVVALLLCTTILTLTPSSSATPPPTTPPLATPLDPTDHVTGESRGQLEEIVIEEVEETVEQMPAEDVNVYIRHRPLPSARRSRLDQVSEDSIQAEYARLFKAGLPRIPPSPLPEETSILTSSSLPAKHDYYPEVGNGHIATVVQSDTVFMNGLYNGYNISSHRAMIDSSVGYRITATKPASLNRTYSLDVGRAYFTESHSSPSVNVSLRVYAHRLLTRVQVVEIELSRSNLSQQVEVSLALSRGCKSDDVDFLSRNGSVFHWRTREPEYEAHAPRTDFYTRASGTLEGTVVMSAGRRTESFLAIQAIGVDPQRVSAEYNRAISMFQSGSLLSSHVDEWAKVWRRGRIDVKGDVNLSRKIYAAFYYILSSLPFHGNDPGWPFIGLSPGGLARGRKGHSYNGHVFWDQDTWMFPTFAVLHSDLSKTIVQTRTKTLDAAKILASESANEGAKYPWESAFTGLETCPAWPYSLYEIHISGDVAMMFRQYWYLTADLDLIKNHSGSEVIQEIAKFWASRVTYQKDDDSYRIFDVMPPDERYWPVNDSAYTNNIAALSLDFANEILDVLGQPRNKTWSTVSSKMYRIYDPVNNYHPEFKSYRLHETVKQADVVLLNFPLMIPMNESTARNDLIYYEGAIPKSKAGLPAMCWQMFLIGWLQFGNEAKAAELLARSALNAQEPFLVWSETADGGGAVNFITGMGGYLQALLFGYGGGRIHPDHLAFDPVVIPGTTEVTFVDVDYRGFSLDLWYNNTEMTLTLAVATSGSGQRLEVELGDSRTWKTLARGSPIETQRQKFKIRTNSVQGS